MDIQQAKEAADNPDVRTFISACTKALVIACELRKDPTFNATYQQWLKLLDQVTAELTKAAGSLLTAMEVARDGLDLVRKGPPD
jgi:hypothetical protein